MGREGTKKQFIIYMAAAYGIAWILQVAISLGVIFGGPILQSLFRPVLSIVMLIPIVAVLIATKGLKGIGWIPKFKNKKFIYIFVAAWLPTILTIAGAVLFFLVFPNSFTSEGEYIRALSGEEAFAQLEAQGMSIPILAAIQLVECLTFAPLINMIFAVGEEAGWRGFMYPYLKKKLGKTLGRIVGGLLWGVWHWPIIILAGYEYGTDYIGAPFVGPILFPIICVFLGGVLDYWYEKSESIWIPALGHGAFNASAAFGLMFLKLDYMRYQSIGPAPVGVISILPLAIYFVVVLVIDKKRNKNK